ncbi:MAG: NUDIX hydrolase [Bacteroidetes bacterium]|nr:NUDIX hydrolase [Bacteroidota bacterium]
MQRNELLRKLKTYSPFDAHETSMAEKIISFIETHPACFERSLQIGHITGSSCIVNAMRTKTLLTHHAKLNKWLQPGGHSDGDADILRVALREALEESGMKQIVSVTDEIFDVDIHEIPERTNEPAHFHYDIRFLFEADERQPLKISSESKNLAWVSLSEIQHYTTEESVLRMVRKLSSRTW